MYRNTGFHVGPTFDLVGERFVDFSNTYKVTSYGLLGLRALLGHRVRSVRRGE
jgi:iron complex outermembrane receptor protein